ncbi:uncharacterized protein LOC125036171 [Penaeus chinensis]|uniref:uncharacterized protein LOC125036171 n=1 Tax=Penaeus chinensis TaxID=139456 RepID=UPI001FB7B4DE|nr:uncharacterized protein LOC125036171 [Penaeus chinensis]
MRQCSMPHVARMLPWWNPALRALPLTRPISISLLVQLLMAVVIKNLTTPTVIHLLPRSSPTAVDDPRYLPTNYWRSASSPLLTPSHRFQVLFDRAYLHHVYPHSAPPHSPIHFIYHTKSSRNPRQHRQEFAVQPTTTNTSSLLLKLLKAM